jgi:hypothetical protein
MPGRFPLNAVSVGGEPFCLDNFCDDSPSNCIASLPPNVRAEGELDPTPGAVNSWYELWYAKLGTPIFLGGCTNYSYTYWSPQRLPLSGSYSGLSLPTFTPSPDVTSPCNVNDVGPNSDPGILRTFTNTDGSPNTSYIQGPRVFYSQFQACPLIEWRVKLYFTTPASPNTIPANQVYCPAANLPYMTPGTQFYPTDYSYYRWVGTFQPAYEPAPGPVITTLWWNTPQPPAYAAIAGYPPWTASRVAYFGTGEVNCRSGYGGGVAEFQPTYTGYIADFPYYAHCGGPNALESTVVGRWEFSNDSGVASPTGTVLATWAGN